VERAREMIVRKKAEGSLFDKSFNHLLGKRLLSRLDDLNATEIRVQLQDKFRRVPRLGTTRYDQGETPSSRPDAWRDWPGHRCGNGGYTN
jgi:hypothetical protein